MSRTFLSAVFLFAIWLPPPVFSTEIRCPKVNLEAPNDAAFQARYRAAAKQSPRLYLAIQRDDMRSIKRHLAQRDNPNACALGASLIAHAVNKGNWDVVDALLQAGAILDQPLNAAGETAMLHAVGERQFMAALHLISRGASVKATIPGGASALHLAANTQVERSMTLQREQLDLIRALLTHGLGANIQTAVGDTALMVAVNLGNVQLVKQLLNFGADAHIKNANGNSALQIARAGQREDISNALQEASAQGTQDAHSLAQLIEQNRPDELAQALAKQPSGAQTFRYKQGLLVAAIHARNPQAISLLVKWGIDPNATLAIQESLDLTVYTPLLFTIAYQSDSAILHALLEAGANPNRYVHPSVFETPLLFALFRQNLEAAEILLKHGANVNLASPNSGTTPLMSAIELVNQPKPARALNFIVSLLAKGAQTNVREEHGMTALHWAAMADYPHEIMRLLLKHGADPNVRDNNNHTPLHYARKYQAKEAVALLTPLTNARADPKPGSPK